MQQKMLTPYNFLLLVNDSFCDVPMFLFFSEIAETIFSGVLTLDICINFKYFEDSEEKGDLISESAKYEAVCRTAPAAMGLIKST